MNKRVRIVAGVCLLAAIGSGIWYIRLAQRVTYQGKTAAEWFSEFCAARDRYASTQRTPMPRPIFSGTNLVMRRTTRVGTNIFSATSFFLSTTIDMGRWFEDPAANGLRALGTNAALYLAGEFRRGDPSWAIRYWKLRARLPKPIQTLAPHGPMPRMFVRDNAGYALEALGQKAAPAVPSLIAGLQDTDRFIRSATIRTLRNLPRPPDDFDLTLTEMARQAQFPVALELIDNLRIRTRTAATVLGEALLTADPETRNRALRQLTYLGANNVVAVPALITTLTNDDSELRYSAASALAEIGSAARPALPVLRQLSDDSSEMVRRAAARALAVIEPEGRKD